VGACDAQKRLDARHIRGMPQQRPPFAVGDSVMLGAADALAHAGIKVNARGCRQMAAGLDILARRKRKHRLPRVVIVELGTNWVVTRADTRRALRILDPGQRLVLVTPRPASDAHDARVMRHVARTHPHRVCVADWRRLSAGHPEWAPGDGIHLSASGIAAFTHMLKPYRRVTAHHPGPCGGSSGSRRSTPRRH
jgi:lysophospholipase L1-like esterase